MTKFIAEGRVRENGQAGAARSSRGVRVLPVAARDRGGTWPQNENDPRSRNAGARVSAERQHDRLDPCAGPRLREDESKIRDAYWRAARVPALSWSR